VKTKHVIVLLGITTVTLLGLYVGANLYIKFVIDEPYYRFQIAEATAMPLFDALNRDVYAQIPLPPGVKKIKEDHYIALSIDYRTVNTTPNLVLAFYKHYFLLHGWEKFNGELPYGKTLYYRGTSCFTIHEDLSSSDKYSVLLEHDYYKQKFSPIVPPKWVIVLNKFGEVSEPYFAHCPPIPDSTPESP